MQIRKLLGEQVNIFRNYTIPFHAFWNYMVSCRVGAHVTVIKRSEVELSFEFTVITNPMNKLIESLRTKERDCEKSTRYNISRRKLISYYRCKASFKHLTQYTKAFLNPLSPHCRHIVPCINKFLHVFSDNYKLATIS
ncbi:1-deoxy-D-xylulose-5-phosphate synthase [Striga asiatica]|uniref:1-deoxy-D-xylulose-5-phosphate synthase n=1 Tax=Striga asiatica TaxID=4170 RepID=A0A5A7QR88_STRAF|nr:1-deoxy-D-xylulose-5-phosphate synthase [Striga asiatica]